MRNSSPGDAARQPSTTPAVQSRCSLQCRVVLRANPITLQAKEGVQIAPRLSDAPPKYWGSFRAYPVGDDYRRRVVRSRDGHQPPFHDGIPYYSPLSERSTTILSVSSISRDSSSNSAKSCGRSSRLALDATSPPNP